MMVATCSLVLVHVCSTASDNMQIDSLLFAYYLATTTIIAIAIITATLHWHSIAWLANKKWRLENVKGRRRKSVDQ